MPVCLCWYFDRVCSLSVSSAGARGGAEAAAVARGGQASVLLKRMVAGITWIGLFVSPTLFGVWLKGLGDETTSEPQ